MGLDISHGAFHGSYAAFDRLREAVLTAIGGKWPAGFDERKDGRWYWPNGGEGPYGKETHPGLYAFLCHSDCDGELAPDIAAKLADELEAILPLIREQDTSEENWGHIKHAGGFGAVTEKLIAGCRAAAAKGEVLTFS